MDPVNVINKALMHCFIDHVMPTPGPGQAQSGFNGDEPYDRYWSSEDHSFADGFRQLNRVWEINVEDPEETTQNEHFGRYWQELNRYRVHAVLVKVRNAARNATGG